MTFDELLGELRYMHTGQDGGIVFGTKSDMMALALAEQIEANRKAIEELRAEYRETIALITAGRQSGSGSR